MAYKLYDGSSRWRAKECAREVLPLSAPTIVYAFIAVTTAYTGLRCANGTQIEHQQIAQQCRELIEQCFPQVYAAL